MISSKWIALISILIVSQIAHGQFLTTNGKFDPNVCFNHPGITRQTYGVVRDVTGWLQRDSDMTRFESVFGYYPHQPAQLFPGRLNKQERPYIQRGQYIALKFTVPTDRPMGRYGYFSFAETYPESNYSMTISEYCGDFRQQATRPKCASSGIRPSGTFLWGVFPANSANANVVCNLEPGKTYYLNIIQAPLNNLQNSYCNRYSCGNSIQNGPGVF